MKQTPISPYTETAGMLYFPRMLNKIRLFEQGSLREDFHDFMGKGLDDRCCDFLRISYSSLKNEVLKEKDDEVILKWCYSQGRELNENDLLIWSHFIKKLGWNDHVSESVINRKKESNLAHRDDIITMAQYMEVDEGRMT